MIPVILSRSTKVYKTLRNACKYTGTKPDYLTCVYNIAGRAIGFAALEKHSRHYQDGIVVKL